MAEGDLATVVCTSTHPVDLPSGRVIAPGEQAEGVDTNDPHARALVLDGHVIVLKGMTPRERITKDQREQLESEARRVARDAGTGRFTSAADAEARPGETVTETIEED